MAGPARMVMQAVAGRATLAREWRIPNSGRVLMLPSLSASQVDFCRITAFASLLTSGKGNEDLLEDC